MEQISILISLHLNKFYFTEGLKTKCLTRVPNIFINKIFMINVNLRKKLIES